MGSLPADQAHEKLQKLRKVVNEAVAFIFEAASLVKDANMATKGNLKLFAQGLELIGGTLAVAAKEDDIEGGER